MNAAPPESVRLRGTDEELLGHDNSYGYKPNVSLHRRLPDTSAI